MVEIHIGTCSLVRVPIAMAAVYVSTPRFGDDFSHRLSPRAAKAYEIFQTSADLPEPEWPDQPDLKGPLPHETVPRSGF